MRYGVVREARFLPPAAVQRNILESLGCDLILQESGVAPEVGRRIDRLLFGVKRDDSVAVHCLDVFHRSAGDLAQLLRNLLEVGAKVEVAASPTEISVLRPDEPVIQALSLLVEADARRPAQGAPRTGRHGNGGSRNRLSKYQVEYARRLYEQGASLRSISLLFQVSPDEVWELMAR